MTVSQLAIARLYLGALLLGVAMEVVYELLRIPGLLLGAPSAFAQRARAISLPLIGNRPRRKHTRLQGVVIFIEDVFVCVFAGVAMILLFYELYSGKIRMVAFLFAAFGFFLSRLSLGKGIRFCAEALAFALVCGVRYLVFFAVFPVRFLGKWLWRNVIQKGRARIEKRGRARETKRWEQESDRLAAFLATGDRIKKRKERQKAKRNEKTIQPEPLAEDLSGRDDRGVARDLYQQRDAL